MKLCNYKIQKKIQINLKNNQNFETSTYFSLLVFARFFMYPCGLVINCDSEDDD